MKTPMQHDRTKKACGSAVLVLIFCLSFQNCTGPRNDTADVGSTTAQSYQQSSSGNGGGYSGKLSYVHRRATADCADGSDVESRIEVEGTRAVLTRENCRDVTARELAFADLNLLPHNPRNLVYGQRIFDQGQEHSNANRSWLFCRGQGTEDVTGRTEIVDAVLFEHRTNDGAELRGRVVLGIYDTDASLADSYDLGEVKVSTIAAPAGFTAYLSDTYERGESFLLRVREADLRATLFYRDQITGRTAGEGRVRPVPYLTCVREAR